MTRRFAGVCVLVCLAAGPALAALDEAGEAAARVLRDAATPQPNGTHEQLLEALRRLRDPALSPFFRYLAAAEQPSLQLHGLLGLAEIDPSHEVSIPAIGEMTYAPLQAELIAAAMDSKLLSLDHAKQLMDWPGLTLPVKLVLATRLLEAGQFSDTALLEEGLKSDNLGRRGLSALMLLQLRDPRGIEALAELDASTQRTRDAVRAELLRTAVKSGFDRAGDWAYSVAMEEDADEDLRWSALGTAMRFGSRPAAATWRAWYEAEADSLARQRLLALLALRVAPWVEPGLFDVLQPSADPMQAAIGRTGRAIASDAPDLADSAAALLDLRHPLVNSWALTYATRDARPDAARVILLAMIAAYQPGEASDRLKRLDDTAQAAFKLTESDPVIAGKLLRPILAEPSTDPLLQQAILLGLLRAQVASVSDVIDGLSFTDHDAARLALVLKAREAAKLSAEEQADLRLIVRGGTKIQGTLRVQAAWVYLKRTQQIDAALTRATSP